MKELKDKWVLITGAASGIGRAVANEFAGCGANIILADIDEAGMESAGREVEGKGAKTVLIRADVSKPGEVESLAKKAIAEAGGVDILVNNAGICMGCEVQDMELDEWEEMLAINLRAPIHLTHHLLPHMLERGTGHIVNIASLAGKVGMPAMAPYSTTKFGLVGYSESIRGDLFDQGIVVTAVCPGVVRTPIIDKMPLRGFSENIREDIPWGTVIPVEKAAKAIVNGVRKNKALVVPATVPTLIAYRLHRLFPNLFAFILRKAAGQIERAPLPGD